MELFVKRARVLPSRDARTEDLWQKAALLYEGDFLPSLDAEWVTERRQVYHELHIETLVGLGECARARGDLRRAIQSFKEALVQDPYREEIHRSVMTCYAELGERKQLLDYIRQLQQRLRTELEVE